MGRGWNRTRRTLDGLETAHNALAITVLVVLILLTLTFGAAMFVIDAVTG